MAYYTRIISLVLLCMDTVLGYLYVYDVYITHTDIDHNGTLGYCGVRVYGLTNITVKWTWNYYREPATNDFTWDIFKVVENRYANSYLYWNASLPREERKLLSGRLWCVVEDEDGEYADYDYSDYFRSNWKPEVAFLQAQPSTDLVLDVHFTLSCSSNDTGYPKGTVVWSAPVIAVNFTSNVIGFNTSSEDHSGIWRCWYTNVYGNGLYGEIEMNVGWIPSPSQLSINDVATKEGIVNQSIIMSCSTLDKGHPPGTVIIVSPFGREYINETITLSSINEKQNGLWRCFYRNVHGDGISGNAFLFVVVNTAYANHTCVGVESLETFDREASSKMVRIETVVAGVLGTLFVVSVAANIVLIICYKRRRTTSQYNDSPKNQVGNPIYANMEENKVAKMTTNNQQHNLDGKTNMAMSIPYEDVDIGTPSKDANLERTSYIELDQIDVHRHRNRNPENAVYASLYE